MQVQVESKHFAPVSHIELQVEIAKRMELKPSEIDESGAIILEDVNLIKIYESFSRDRVLNLKEYFPMKLLEGRLFVFCRLVKMEGLTVEKGKSVRQGVLEE